MSCFLGSGAPWEQLAVVAFGPGAALVAGCVSEQGVSEVTWKPGIIQVSIELRLKQVVEFIYPTPPGCVTLQSQTNS